MILGRALAVALLVVAGSAITTASAAAAGSPLLDIAAGQFYLYPAGSQQAQVGAIVSTRLLASIGRDIDDNGECQTDTCHERWQEAFSDLGLAYSRLGQHLIALDAYRRALVNASDAAAAHTDIGIQLEMIGNQEGARQEFETARELRGDTVNVGYEGIVARFHLLNDELDDARSHFEKCVRVGRPEKTIQYCSIGLVLLKWRGGHDSLLTAFALGTTWPRPLLDFVRGKDNEEALARTILAMPDASARRTALCEALYYAGEGALQHGDKPQALRYFRASVSMRVESFWENLAAQRRIEQLHGNDDPKPPPPPASHIPIS